VSYDPQFVRRLVKERRHILGGWWELTLECGHKITRRTIAGSKVKQPVCYECNEKAAELGLAKRILR
jgi:hypothetical protein